MAIGCGVRQRPATVGVRPELPAARGESGSDEPHDDSPMDGERPAVGVTCPDRGSIAKASAGPEPDAEWSGRAGGLSGCVVTTLRSGRLRPDAGRGGVGGSMLGLGGRSVRRSASRSGYKTWQWR
eukprot:1691255-Prymnesium_polylepis.1